MVIIQSKEPLLPDGYNLNSFKKDKYTVIKQL